MVITRNIQLIIVAFALLASACSREGTRVYMAKDSTNNVYVFIIENHRYNHPSLVMVVIPKSIPLGPGTISIDRITFYGVYLVSGDSYRDTSFFGMTEKEFEIKMKKIINTPNQIYQGNLTPKLDGTIIVNPTTHRFECNLWSKGYPNSSYYKADYLYTDFRE